MTGVCALVIARHYNMIEYNSVTEPLPNGAPLPQHPDDTTAKKIVHFGFVYDADDGVQLSAGLHRNEISVLMSGQRILDHAYRYAIVDRRIFHTRAKVIIHVATEPSE